MNRSNTPKTVISFAQLVYMATLVYANFIGVTKHLTGSLRLLTRR